MNRFNALILCSVMMLTLFALGAQIPGFSWVQSCGGLGSDDGNCIASLPDGSSYVSGTFCGEAVFGQFSLNANDNIDIFVLKLNPGGEIQWVRQAGSSVSVKAKSISVDSSGNTYLAGHFEGSASFGNTVLFENGDYGTDIFVAKIDAQGNWLWAVQAGGTKYDTCNGICTDLNGDSYITGAFGSSAVFGSHQVTGGIYPEIYVAKLDSTGYWLWAIMAGGIDPDEAIDICLADNGYIYVTGYFEDLASFGNLSLLGFGSADIFVAKVSSSGSWIWVNRAGGPMLDRGLCLSSDTNGDCVISGYFMGNACFGAEILQSYGSNYDIFIAKLDHDGDFLWARKAGGARWNDVGNGIGTDAQGSIYCTGYFYYAAEFGPHALIASAENEVFLTKLDSAGNWIWAQKAGGSSDDFCRDLSLDHDSNLYITGAYWGDSSFGSFPFTSNGTYDIFVAKLSASSSIGDEHDPELPSISCLQAAYPNPTGHSGICIIKANLPEHETGVLAISNLRGQIIRKYVLEPGNHQINFDTTGLASGIYCYRLETKTGCEIRNLLILR